MKTERNNQYRIYFTPTVRSYSANHVQLQAGLEPDPLQYNQYSNIIFSKWHTMEGKYARERSWMEIVDKSLVKHQLNATSEEETLTEETEDEEIQGKQKVVKSCDKWAGTLIFLLLMGLTVLSSTLCVYALDSCYGLNKGASVEDVFPSINDSVIIEAGNLENEDDTEIMKGEEMPVDPVEQPGELDELYDFDFDLDLNSDFYVVSVPQENNILARPDLEKSQASSSEKTQSKTSSLDQTQSQASSLDQTQSKASSLDQTQSKASSLDQTQSQASSLDQTQSQAGSLNQTQSQASSLDQTQSQARSLELNQTQSKARRPYFPQASALQTNLNSKALNLVTASNLPWGPERSHTEFGPDLFCCFDVLDTNGQTDNVAINGYTSSHTGNIPLLPLLNF
ncbi:uncharacterized protein LOC111699288 [Eurytemora carolleeae]|uniref:uncharacterized protein LOC111699288 n=1 Tax=Eurytemora carolleeae TaxID=1294199 RepID=UPI000C787FED|nr:uncharacterized protein LOC111699288 [Eurytemora carolleeae]|eukprot:XP_023325688.1 uncharacterized protein LOC111699288 [Eurytemora affinis]